MVREDPKSAGDLLKGFLPQLQALGAVAGRQQALEAVLGPETAAHCRVAGFHRGQLLVEVDSAPLFADLQMFRREELRAELNRRDPGHPIAHLVFRLAGVVAS